MFERFLPKGDAVGSRIRMGPDLNASWIEVVGVVGDVRNDPALPTSAPMAYAPLAQDPWGAQSFVLLRTPLDDPLSLARPIQRELSAVDPALPVHQTALLPGLLDAGLSARRVPVVLMTAFGALALLLASVGVYAIFAAMAAAPEREFGVRVALGSSRGAIARLVLRQGAVWMGAGVVGGALGVVVVARLLRDLLYGVQPFDPVTLAGTAAVLLACATVALLVPVRRATRVDPVSVLR